MTDTDVSYCDKSELNIRPVKISNWDCCVLKQLMVNAVLEIMQKAVVPWSNTVEKLCQQYLEMDGPKYVCFQFLFGKFAGVINICCI